MYVYSDVAIVQTSQVQVGEPSPISFTHWAHSSTLSSCEMLKRENEKKLEHGDHRPFFAALLSNSHNSIVHLLQRIKTVYFQNV